MTGARFAVLGAGSILPRAGYGSSGYALRPGHGEPWVLFDCGPGSLRALGALHLGVEDVGAVVLSHYHPDHCLDLAALLFARRNPELRRKPPLEVIGPAGLLDLRAGLATAFGRWVEEPSVTWREFAVDGSGRWSGALALGGCTLALAAAANGHTPNAVSWRVSLPSGFELGYTGDSGEVAAVAELCRDVDLFVAECAFPAGQEAEHHLTPHSAARLALAARAKSLLLTHFYPSVDPAEAVAQARALGAPAFAAHDGLCVPLIAPIRS